MFKDLSFLIIVAQNLFRKPDGNGKPASRPNSYRYLSGEDLKCTAGLALKNAYCLALPKNTSKNGVFYLLLRHYEYKSQKP